MLVATNATNVRTPVQVVNADNAPVTGLTYLSAITFGYRRPADAAFTDVSLVDGTSAHTDGGFRSLGGHVYEFCWPDAVVVPGEATLVRYVYDGVTRYDVIEARIAPLDPTELAQALATEIGATADELAQAVATRLSAIQLSVQQQITISGGTQLSVVQGDDYTRVGVRIDLDTSGLPDPDEDLSEYKFVIAIQAANVFGVRMSIEGDPGEHYVTFAPASTVTETWPVGRYNCLYRLEIAENKYETIGVQGVIEITPFDIDEDQITDIDVEE